MKTNITINLFGQLYHVDEDAYELLKNHEEQVRILHPNPEESDQIIHELEKHLVKGFDKLTENRNTAITIEQMQALLQELEQKCDTDDSVDADPAAKENDTPTMCPPPPFEEQPARDNTPNSTTAPRRLYRDIPNAIIGGVSSGISQYFGISDPIFVRIVWIILFFVPCIPATIIYLVLWIIVPACPTLERRD